MNRRDAAVDVCPQVYDDIDENLEVIEPILRDFFAVDTAEGYDIIRFSRADSDDYLDAIDTAPSLIIPLFLRMANLSKREVHHQCGIEKIFSRYIYVDDPPTRNEEMKYFSNFISHQIEMDLPFESVFQMYERSIERTHRALIGDEFYKDLHQDLEQHGVEVEHDYTLPGCPNIVVRDDDDDLVLAGRAMDTQAGNLVKRARHMFTRLGKFTKHHPDLPTIAVFLVPPEKLDRGRRITRNKVENVNTAIDRVFFDDEPEEIASFIKEQLE